MILCFMLKLANGSAKLYYPSCEAFKGTIVLIFLLPCLVDSSVYSAHAVWASLIDYQLYIYHSSWVLTYNLDIIIQKRDGSQTNQVYLATGIILFAHQLSQTKLDGWWFRPWQMVTWEFNFVWTKVSWN